ncbi:MAG: twin-arginine translocase TatA/TatE family subunit [Bdellovibrionales bacterium]|nr:twin-arginine translocase TatA/TatE family subunit [Bdellovibrionales bacterium]
MLGIGTPELIVIGLIIIIFYGPDRLPTLLAKINRVFRDIKHATSDVQKQINREIAKVESNVLKLEEDPNHQSQDEKNKHHE